MAVKTKSKVKKEQVKEISLAEYIDKLGEISSKRKKLEAQVKDLKKQEESIEKELLKKGLIKIGEMYRGTKSKLKTFKYVTPIIDSFKAAKILKKKFSNTDFNNIFSEVFTLNKTAAKKYLSEIELMKCTIDEKVSERFKID